MVWRAFGVRGLGQRVLYVAMLRTGLAQRRLPRAFNFEAAELCPWTFRFDLAVILQRYQIEPTHLLCRQAVLQRADRIMSGWLSFYGGAERNVGWPPVWHRLSADAGIDLSAHWTQLTDKLGPVDVKDIWEPSRFTFTFVLARAYLLTGNDRFVEAWWTTFENWCEANPPNTGPNWRCGQESSLRAIAVSFALSTFAASPASTPERSELASRFLGATRRRVRTTLAYALSQRNNHSISELAFLLSLPGTEARLEGILRRALRDQWYPDGSYSQQSLNYQRLAVHALVWLLQTQPKLEQRTVFEIRRCLSLSAAFLRRCADPVAGRWPNSGANDGALLFDLDSTERWDARPTLALLGCPHPSRSFSETAAWLPPEHLQLPDIPPADDTTFITLRGPRSLAFTHVGSARHRQGHHDQQALEIIMDGEPIVLDPGSYRYNSDSLWRRAFASASAHSSLLPEPADPTVIDREMESIGSFLISDMPVAQVTNHDLDNTETLTSVRRDASMDLIRTINRHGDTYHVIDRASTGRCVVRWLLPADAAISFEPGGLTARTRTARLQITTSGIIRVEQRSTDDPFSGWWSPVYGEREAAIAVSVGADHAEPVTTVVQPHRTTMSGHRATSTGASTQRPNATHE